MTAEHQATHETPSFASGWANSSGTWRKQFSYMRFVVLSWRSDYVQPPLIMRWHAKHNYGNGIELVTIAEHHLFWRQVQPFLIRSLRWCQKHQYIKKNEIALREVLLVDALVDKSLTWLDPSRKWIFSIPHSYLFTLKNPIPKRELKNYTEYFFASKKPNVFYCS